MTKKKKPSRSEQDALRMRVSRLKTGFPENFDYTPVYEYEFGKQKPEHLNKVRAVWNLRTTDPLITERLERIAKKATKQVA